jgi:hypothetical protein
MLASQTLPCKPPKKGEAPPKNGKHSRCELAVALETAAGTQFRAFWPEHSGPSILARAFWPEHSGPSILARAFWPEHVRSQLCPARCCLT